MYELRQWLKSPAPYLYFAAFFTLTFLAFAGNAGFFDPPTDGSQLQRVINSPHEINYMMQYFNKFFLFLLPAIVGATLYKDYKHDAHQILYSFPINKTHYLMGKFLSAFTTVVWITFASGLAIFVAENLPGLAPDMLAVTKIAGYLQVYLVFIIPNMLIHGALVFSVVVWSRNIYAGFGMIILLLFMQIITVNAFDGQGALIALLDPFGQHTTQYITHLWTLEEQNSMMIPIMGPVLYNRMLWLGLSASVFIITWRKFCFTEEPLIVFKAGKEPNRMTKKSDVRFGVVSLTAVAYRYNFKSQLRACWRLSGLQLRYIVKSWVFIGLVLLGILAVLFTIARVTNFEEMALLPVTRIVLSVPAFFFTGIVILITFLYAGMLLHRERTAKMNELIDVTAAPGWVLILSKVLALVKLQGLLLLIMLICGVSIQVYNGYYLLEPGMYFFHLFIITFPVLIIWTFAAVFIHSMVPNLYLGLFVLVLGWIGVGGLPQAGINTRLLLFNMPPELIGSDLSGYGNSLAPYFLVEGYWFISGTILLCLAYLLQPRGMASTIRERLMTAKGRLTKPLVGLICILLACFALLGSAIYQFEAVENDFSQSSLQRTLRDFEKEFGHFAGAQQPRITSVNLKLDFYPERNDFRATGSYTLINKSIGPIDTLLIKTGFDEISHFDLNVDYQTIAYDSTMQFSVIRLVVPLTPGDSVNLSFGIRNKDNTFFQRNSSVLANGTFLGSDALPRLGYSFTEEKKLPTDSTVGKNSYAAIDADLVDFEVVMSTSPGQTALAPGTLQREWIENDRHFFHYTTKEPIKFSFNFNSARYAVVNDQWKGVNLSVYYHRTHDHNLNSLLAGLKTALDYNGTYLSPYQHLEARIIEFPMTEGSHATAMANNIPTSEMRFIANTQAESGKVDQSFYVAAHELTHLWWGNQVMPADALGAVMITESITEYFSLRIYETQYGKEKADQFLRLQWQRYLKGRTTEQGLEPPLILVARPQQYISYGKGAMAFNSLMHYLGEKQLNDLLKSFLEANKASNGIYPTSLDLIDHLKAHTADSMRYAVEDWFEKVVLYDNVMEKARIQQSGDGTFQVDLNFTIDKKVLSGKTMTPAALADYVQIGFYDRQGALIYLHTQKISEKENSLSISLDQKPTRVVLDPNLLMIDRSSGDNEFRL
jgi:ABC-2 type transport system permease protein